MEKIWDLCGPFGPGTEQQMGAAGFWGEMLVSLKAAVKFPLALPRHGQSSADLLTVRAGAGACLVASPCQLLCTINYGHESAGFPSSVAPVCRVGRSWDENRIPPTTLPNRSRVIYASDNAHIHLGWRWGSHKASSEQLFCGTERFMGCRNLLPPGHGIPIPAKAPAAKPSSRADQFSICGFLADLLPQSRGRAVLGHWQPPDIPGNLSAVSQR